MKISSNGFKNGIIKLLQNENLFYKIFCTDTFTYNKPTSQSKWSYTIKLIKILYIYII